MKWYKFLASIIGIGFWGWLAIAVFGITSTHAIIVFPLGGLPIVIGIGYLLFIYLQNTLQKNIGSKIRDGITEYPLEISMCLYGENDDKISFSEDGKSVILTVKSPQYKDIDKPIDAKDFLLEKIYYLENLNLKWFEKYIISDISKNSEDSTHKITVSVPDEVVLSEQYIEHEIKNLGRVFKRNDGGNNIRWLLNYHMGERKIIRRDGKLIVFIERSQFVPSVFGEKEIIMSKNQIIRNIKNRLWNRVDVKCITIDDKTFCGEIVGV